MEDIPNTPPVEDTIAPVKMGVLLREKRLAMGLSVADVAAQIRLAPRQIEALEADDLAHLPELPFVRGFVRSYAKLLHLDDQPLLAALPAALNVSARIEPVSVDAPFDIKQLSKQQNKIWLIASMMVLVIALVFAVWHFSSPKSAQNGNDAKSNVLESAVVLPDQIAAGSSVEEVSAGIDIDAPVSAVPPAVSAIQTPPAQPVLKSATTLVQSVAPVVQAASAVMPAAAGVTKLRLVFDAESWTEVTDATGAVLSSQINAAGSELNLNGSAPYELVIGNAKAVHLYRRGKAVDLSSHINTTSEVARLTLE